MIDKAIFQESDMASKSSSRALTDHEEIRRWAEERGAKPAAVRNTGNDDDDVGIIRLDFPGYSGQGSLEEISWDEWFDNFEDNELALVVQDKMANGQKSNFNKLVSRDTVTESSQSESAGSKKTNTGRASKRTSGKSSVSASQSRQAKKKPPKRKAA